MPSLPDTAVIILLGLLLFGPKGLAQIARQLGKLMGEFRRASNEFRMQMEDELRISEQADRQKEIAAIEAAAPAPPVLQSSAEDSSADHLHLPAVVSSSIAESGPPALDSVQASGPLPIASSGELSIMPPATGLPGPRASSLSSLIDSVPRVDGPGAELTGVSTNGQAAHSYSGTQGQLQTHSEQNTAGNGTSYSVAEESLHG